MSRCGSCLRLAGSRTLDVLNVTRNICLPRQIKRARACAFSRVPLCSHPSVGGSLWDREGDGEAAAGAVGEGDAAAVGLGDLADEGEAEAGAAALGGVKGEEGVGEDGFGHAGAAVGDLDGDGVGEAADAEGDVGGGGAGFVGVSEEVDEGLLELGGVEVGAGFGEGAVDVEVDLAAQAV